MHCKSKHIIYLSGCIKCNRDVFGILSDILNGVFRENIVNASESLTIFTKVHNRCLMRF